MVCFVLPLCAFLFYCPFTILTTRGTTHALSSFKRFAGDGNTTPRTADKRNIKHHCSADEVQLHLRKQFLYTGAREAEGYGNRLSYKLTTQTGVTATLKLRAIQSVRNYTVRFESYLSHYTTQAYFLFPFRKDTSD